MEVEILKRRFVRHHHSNEIAYEVREEIWRDPEGHPVRMTNAYNPQGDYIGEPRWAYNLIMKLNIAPEKNEPEDCVCSIGFCKRDKRWYGWSHRAMRGFAVGDMILADSLDDTPEIDTGNPMYQADSVLIMDLEQAKQIARKFAESVS